MLFLLVMKECHEIFTVNRFNVMVVNKNKTGKKQTVFCVLIKDTVLFVVCHMSGYMRCTRCNAPTQSRPDIAIFGLFCLQYGLLLGELSAKV